MSKESEKPVNELFVSQKPLISRKEGHIYVMVSHEELDDLVGTVMQMFELNGDVEQRNALKSEFKWRARKWLDLLYDQSGYRNYEIIPEAKVIEV